MTPTTHCAATLGGHLAGVPCSKPPTTTRANTPLCYIHAARYDELAITHGTHLAHHRIINGTKHRCTDCNTVYTITHTICPNCHTINETITQ